MFGRKSGEKRKSRKAKKAEAKAAHQQEIRKGLLFWLPGGSSRLDVYVDYCILRCLGKTKMKEKFREIKFTDITKVVYTPASSMRLASLQIFTKDMPDVKRSFWYPYENNMVVVHPGTEDLAQKILEYLRNPYGSNVVPPEYLNQLKKERKQALREEAEAKAKAQEEAEAKNKGETAAGEEAAEAETPEAAEASPGEEAPAEGSAAEAIETIEQENEEA